MSAVPVLPRPRCPIALALLLLVIANWARGDEFTVQQDNGVPATVEARLAGEGQGHLVLERRDGSLEPVPQDQIIKRVPAADPTPISPETMLERLTERFGKANFRGHCDQTYVIGIVLAEPLPKKYETKAASLLKQATNFMKSVEKVFMEFVDDLKIETVKPRYPLVLLIFEIDDDFIKFANEETGGQGLSGGNILGFYSKLTNHLVIRMSECHTFETPLHEAIHQQVYNRGLLQRLGPSPAWFNEGIATGFEGTGEKINSGPLRVNPRYAKAAMKAQNVDWDDVVADDAAFRGDVLAGEAYANAWSIHWFLVTKYRKQYIEYLQLLSQKKPLEKDDARTRISDFENIFGKRVGKLQSEFPKALQLAANKQKVNLDPAKPPGYLLVQSNLAEVEMSCVTVNGRPLAEGRMRNMSRLRPMAFHITVQTNSGTYAEWHLPSVDPHKQIELGREQVLKRMKSGPGGPFQKFYVRVKTAVPESETAQQWMRGPLPIPE